MSVVIQQVNNELIKVLGHSTTNIGDLTSYAISSKQSLALSAGTGTGALFKFLKPGILNEVEIDVRYSVIGTNEVTSLYLYNFSTSTEVLIGTIDYSITQGATLSNVIIYNTSITVNDADLYYLREQTQNMVTNPVGVVKTIELKYK